MLPLKALDRKLHADPILALGGAKEILLGASRQRPVAGLEPLGDVRIVEPLERIIKVLVAIERHQPHLLAFPSVGHIFPHPTPN